MIFISQQKMYSLLLDLANWKSNSLTTDKRTSAVINTWTNISSVITTTATSILAEHWWVSVSAGSSLVEWLLSIRGVDVTWHDGRDVAVADVDNTK